MSSRSREDDEKTLDPVRYFSIAVLCEMRALSGCHAYMRVQRPSTTHTNDGTACTPRRRSGALLGMDTISVWAEYVPRPEPIVAFVDRQFPKMTFPI